MKSTPAPGTWVLLRGLGREIGHWAGFESRLREALAPATVVAIDLPGVGMARDRLPAWSIEGIMEDVRGRVSADTARPLGLFAISLGGMVAYEWWLRHPEEVASLVLLNTSFQTYSRFYRRLRPGIWPLMVSSTIEKDAVERERQILRIVSRRPEHYDRWARDFARIVEERPVAVDAIFRQFVAALNYRPPRKAPDVPTLILASAADAMVHPNCSLAIASDWAAPIHYHPTAGHDLTLDEPAWVAQKVQEFAASL